MKQPDPSQRTRGDPAGAQPGERKDFFLSPDSQAPRRAGEQPDSGGAESPHVDVSVISDSGHSVAFVRAATSGCLSAVFSTALFVLRKRQPPSFGWRWHAAAGCGGAAFGWWYSRWKQRVQEQGLARLRKVSGTGTAFMALDSLAPPLPPDVFTEAGERAAEKLMKQNRFRTG
ncbi:putative transmembrane protein [Toxoplasma gondii RUB]|uniref:Putative transmembrane protein n=2 Tax=Toxoplasma gondii TaxID=5811 RepID=A0A086LSH1_TOXGO|nr:putative transmembrane protein [Toxoplasma gondii RUB]KFH03426.1 putative transmembrane protein [Toxoplasma gondii VAND]